MSHTSYTILPLKDGLNSVADIFCDGKHIGLKKKNSDLGFIYSKHLLEVEALFTQNRFKAAPLLHFLTYPKDFKTNFILLNSKNANAMTGQQGLNDVRDILSYAQNRFIKEGVEIINPLMSSTGVIGQSD